MNLEDAIRRIEELERHVKELEARPPIVINVPTQYPPYLLLYNPINPWTPVWTTTTGDTYAS